MIAFATPKLAAALAALTLAATPSACAGVPAPESQNWCHLSAERPFVRLSPPSITGTASISCDKPVDSVQLTVYLQRQTKHGDYSMPPGMKRSVQTKDTPTRKMTATATYLQCYPVDDEVVWQTFATAKVTWRGQTKWQNDQALTAGAIVCPG